MFLRVTFTFPPSYPASSATTADPSVEIERSPLIAPNVRAFLIRKLRGLRHERPCLRECLRFLLGSSPDEPSGFRDDSSEDEAAPNEKNVADDKDIMLQFVRGHKNIPEFRTVQGMLGPSGM